MHFELKDKRLVINGKLLDKPARIWKVLELNSSLVVLFTAYNEEDIYMSPTNVFCLDENGNKLWEIEALNAVRGNRGAFTNIWLNKHGKLMAGNFLGFDCEVDPRTGKILDYEFTK